MTAAELVVYRVTVDTPAGTTVLYVPTRDGPDAASRHARWTAIHSGWGSLDEITVTDVTAPCPDARCDTETHYAGRPAPDGEDTETGPCPRWADTGAVHPLTLLVACVVSGLLWVALIAAGAEVVCAVNTTPGDRPHYCEPEVQR
jgi:hypothetical protein